MSEARHVLEMLSAESWRGVHVSEVSLPMDRFLSLCAEAGGLPGPGERLTMHGPGGTCHVRGYGEATSEGRAAYYAALVRRGMP